MRSLPAPACRRSPPPRPLSRRFPLNEPPEIRSLRSPRHGRHLDRGERRDLVGLHEPRSRIVDHPIAVARDRMVSRPLPPIASAPPGPGSDGRDPAAPQPVDAAAADELVADLRTNQHVVTGCPETDVPSEGRTHSGDVTRFTRSGPSPATRGCAASRRIRRVHRSDDVVHRDPSASQRTVTSSPSVVPFTVRMPSATFEKIVPACADGIHTIIVAMADARARRHRMRGIRYRLARSWRRGGSR